MHLHYDGIAAHAKDLVAIVSTSLSQALASLREKQMHCAAKAASVLLQATVNRVNALSATRLRPTWASITAFMKSVQAPDVALSLGARRLVMLMTDSFASSLQLQDAADVDVRTVGSLLCLSSSESGLMYAPGHPPYSSLNSSLRSGPMTWLQELLEGNPVVMPSALLRMSKSTQSPPSRAVSPTFRPFSGAMDDLEDGEGVGGQLGQSFELQLFEESRSYIANLVLSIDSSAASALLLPLRTRYGLSIILLLDKSEPAIPAVVSELRDGPQEPGGGEERWEEAGGGFPAAGSAFRGLGSGAVTRSSSGGGGSIGVLGEFTPTDAEILRTTGVSDELSNTLELILQAADNQAAAHAVSRSRLSVAALGEQLAVDRSKAMASKALLKWHMRTAINIEKKIKSNSGSMLACAVELLKMRRLSVNAEPHTTVGGAAGGGSSIRGGGSVDANARSASARERGAFFSVIEAQTSRLFPADAVVASPTRLSLSDVSAISAGSQDDTVTIVNLHEPESSSQQQPSHSGPHSRMGTGSGLGLGSAGETQRIIIRPQALGADGRVGRNVLVGVIKYREALSAPSMQHSTDITDAIVIGTVRIARARVGRDAAGQGHSAQFTMAEANLLCQLCELFSDIYTALRRGMAYDFGDGDTQGLFLPALSQIVPALLDASMKGHDDLCAVLPAIAQWTKRICGSDVTLLRLLAVAGSGGSSGGSGGGGGSGGTGANAGATTTTAEVLVSSEESLPRAGRGSEAGSRTRARQASIQDLIFDVTSASFATHHSEDAPATALSSSASLAADDEEDRDRDRDRSELLAVRAGADQIIMKLLKSAEDSSVIGELKVVGTRSGFDPEHLAAVKVIAYILSHSISAGRRLKQVCGQIYIDRDSSDLAKDSQ